MSRSLHKRPIRSGIRNRKEKVMNKIVIIAVVILAATAIFVGAWHEEYNRYAFYAASDRDTVAGYRMDKRTGKISLIAGFKQFDVFPESVIESTARELGIK